MAKVKYVSPYTNEMINSPIGEYLIQYKDQEDKLLEMSRREAWIKLRSECDTDLKLTPYCQTRCTNIIEKIFKAKTIDDVISCCISAANISFSGYFPYREFLDILTEKMNTISTDGDDLTILKLVKMSLEKNYVIASKIVAFYKNTVSTDET
jgi:hypothetical protein